MFSHLEPFWKMLVFPTEGVAEAIPDPQEGKI